jgi:hypothetical protein
LKSPDYFLFNGFSELVSLLSLLSEQEMIKKSGESELFLLVNFFYAKTKQ